MGEPLAISAAASFLAFAVPLFVYAVTLQGGVAFWDTGEMQTVPWVFGIAHPTGFAFFTLLAGLFAHIYAVGAVSARIALFCALAAASCAWLIYRIAFSMGGDPVVCLLFAWMYAAGNIVWSRGTRAEAHDLAAFLALAGIALAIEWGRSGNVRLLFSCVLVLALGIATHPIVVLILPGIMLVMVRSRVYLSPRTVAVALCCFAAGLLPFAYFPLRSSAVLRAGLDPNTRLGKAPGAAIWNTDDPRTLKNFVRLTTGADFAPSRTLQNALSSRALFARLKTLAESAYWEFGPLGCISLMIGLGLACASRRYNWGWIAIAAIVPAMFAAGYTIEADPQRYLLIPFALGAIVAAYGSSQVPSSHLNLVRGVPAAACVMLAMMNAGNAYARHTSSARWLVDDIRARTPANAIIVAYWSVGTPLAYAAYVERSMARRTIDIAFLGEDEALVRRWLEHRPVFVYGSINANISGVQASAVEAGLPFYRLMLTPRRERPKRSM